MKPKTTALLLVLAVLLLAAAGFLPCGIRLFFGVPCPMCGITRAYMTLLDGDFCAALRYHPLFWLLPLAALLLAIVKNKTARRIILILTIIAFTAHILSEWRICSRRSRRWILMTARCLYNYMKGFLQNELKYTGKNTLPEMWCDE